MKLETLKDLYIHELKDLYSAEKQIINALPKMVKAATDKQLAAGFEEHFEQTKEHAARLEKILTSHDESTRGPKCEGMEGVIKEGEEMIAEDAEDEARRAALGRRVEHRPCGRREVGGQRLELGARRGPVGGVDARGQLLDVEAPLDRGLAQVRDRGLALAVRRTGHDRKADRPG